VRSASRRSRTERLWARRSRPSGNSLRGTDVRTRSGPCHEDGGPVSRKRAMRMRSMQPLSGTGFTLKASRFQKPGGLAVLHARVTSPSNSGIANDPTWRPGREYFGIPFRLDYVLRMCGGTGHLGVLDIWELGWPLLRGDDPIEDVMWKSDRQRET
jgi:hypothetical protein